MFQKASPDHEELTPHPHVTHTTAKEAFADAFDSTPPSEEDYQRWFKRPRLQFPEFGKVAWQGKQVAGMVHSSIKREENERSGRCRSWVEDVCLRAAW